MFFFYIYINIKLSPKKKKKRDDLKTDEADEQEVKASQAADLRQL